MLKIKNLRGECQHCGEVIEFHAEHAGSVAACPHCGQNTELLLALPPEAELPVRRKAVVFTVAALCILVLGLVALGFLFKRAQRRIQSASPPVASAAPAAAPFVSQGFKVSPVRLEKEPGTAILYACATITNLTNCQRFGVKVDLKCFDAEGALLGTTSDYQKIMEPGGQWQFHALVTDKRATAARIEAITETR